MVLTTNPAQPSLVHVACQGLQVDTHRYVNRVSSETHVSGFQLDRQQLAWQLQRWKITSKTILL